MVDFITILGFSAGTITSIGFLPQVIKTFRTKHVDDLALFMPILLSFGMLLWLIYGIFRKDAAIIAANIFAVLCNSSLIFAKIKYSSKT